MPTMALDTSGVYRPGDDYKVIKILGLPFGEYTLDCVSNCMNQLEILSPEAAADLVSMIDAWEVADNSQTETDLSQGDGSKVLVKADVLEWEVINGGASGTSSEKGKLVGNISNLLSFCSCLGGLLPGYGGAYGMTSLIRS